jgi:glutaryl-CoA dehydrogenase
MSRAAIDVQNLPYADADFFAFEQLLSAKEQDRLAEVREFLAREVRPIAVDCWNRAEFPMELLPKLADIDLVSPVRRQGYSNLFAGILHAEATRADTSIATFMGVHDGLFTGSIEALASQEQQDAWLPDIYSLKKIGAFGLTEPLGGSDVAGGTRTTARRDGGNWIINGAKRWIGNATFSDWVVIYARDVDDNQVKGFLVDTASEGYSAQKIENKISLRTVQNADITLENVVVPDFFKLANANSFRDTNKVASPWHGRRWASSSRPSTSPGATPLSAASSAARLPPSSWSKASSCRSSGTRSAPWA